MNQGYEQPLLTRIADPGMYERIRNRDAFFAAHPNPTLQEIDDFYAEFCGYRITANQDLGNRLAPTTAAVAGNPVEAQFLREALAARISRSNDFTVPATEEARLLIDFESDQEIKIIILIARCIGFERAAALIEVELRLVHMIQSHMDEGFELLIPVWNRNREEIKREIVEREQTMTVEEARTILATAFDLRFDQYNELLF